MPNDIAEPEIETAAAGAAEPAPKAEAEQVAAPADTVVDVVTATQQEALESIETAGAAVLAGVGTVQREIAEFVADRIRTDFDTQAALLRCRSFSEVHSVQAEFLRTAYDNYASEASRLVRLGGEMMTRSLDRNPN